jgi:hypothetical protein
MDPEPKPDDDKPEPPAPKPDDDKPEPAADGEVERMRAALAKANKEAETSRKKLKEYEDAGKSELEKATGRISELERELGETTGRALKLEVAAEKGLTSAQAKRPGARPKPRLKPGSGNDTEAPDETNPRKLAALIPRR